MKTDLFDFELPDSLIATHPATKRDEARMLVLDGTLQDRIIKDLPQFLKSGDVMVFNDTRVIPARLFGKRGQAGIECLLHKRTGRTLWSAFAKPAKKLRVGDRIDFADDFSASVVEKCPSGEVMLQFEGDDPNLHRQLAQHGHMPLPPYIERQRKDSPAHAQTDRERYQTVYARNEGSVAAPTAGLHFTDSLLAAIDAMGVQRVHVTLHVGGGTFLPVKVEDTDDHVMHSEYAEISQSAADTINAAKQKGGRVIAVGTTSLRTLESATDTEGIVHAFHSETAIFITPGYRFRLVDILLTNFHLPRSTLFMLVAAFCGLDPIKNTYNHAINNGYRFYSYGDACLLFCNR